MGAREKVVEAKQDPRWPNAHIRLQQLWQERAPMSQEKFGAEFDIGNQSMVSQYLNGINPLNIEAASKFAQGLGCHIKDISPEMDRYMRRLFLPALGLAAWGKMLLLVLLLIPAAPSEAAILHNAGQPHSFFAKSLNLYTLYVVARRALMRFMRGIVFA
jgi:hypothetical protein